MEMLNALESAQQFDDEVIEDDDDDIYEQIEAPKYVDLTRPDQFLTDDRSWFCLRIGCDQNHDDVDPDALHKSFVLRVMAARSPNLKLRKALRSRQVPSAYMKYPKSAPAKPSKPRICGFAAMTSVSRKIDLNGKPHPISKNSSTPMMKPKIFSASAKSLTTPRVKKSIPASQSFRSVRNPHRTDAPQNTKVVAKELVFDSPKKSERKKSTVEIETPVAAICDGMKNLQLHSQRKKPSKNVSQASSISTAGHPKKSRPASDSSTSELYRRKLKSQVKDSEDRKTTKTKAALKLSRLSLRSVANSDMDIDGESRNGSFGVCSASGTSKSNVGSGNKEQSDIRATTMQEESLPSTKLPNADNIMGFECGSVPNSKDSKERVDPGVTEASAKALVVNTPKLCKNEGFETPLTDICNGLKKLEINSHIKKPTWDSSKKSLRSTASRPKKSRTAAADPSTSKLCSQKTKNRITDSKHSKSKNIKVSQKLSCPIGDENDGESRRGSFSVCTAASETPQSKDGNGNEQQSDVSMTTQEECLPSSEIISVEENQVLPDVSNCVDANSLPTSKKTTEEGYFLDHRIPDREGEVGQVDELKISGERDECTRVTNPSEETHLPSSDTHLESEVMNDDGDKENAAASDANRNAKHGNNLPSENHENQLKAIHADGKILKGRSAVATGSFLRKYKKTKPTNPKPFRLRTDERGVLREANLEKRHPPAPLKEISAVSDGHIQKRQAHERNEEKMKSRGPFRQEGVAQVVNQIEADKGSQIHQEQKKATYCKTSKSEVEPKTATTSTQGHIKREFRTTKSQLLRQQLIKTQSKGNESRKTKTMISQGPSRRLSTIKEKPSTILRPRDGKASNKGTLRSSPRVKKPTTIPKEPKFHTTPKACRNTPSLLK